MITSPLRPRDQQQEPGIAARGQLAQPRNALRRFTFVRHHDAPRASFRPALTEASRRPRYPRPSSGRPVNSGPRPCLRCWIPPIGLQVRTYTSDLNIRARHTSDLAPRGSAFATTGARRSRSKRGQISTGATRHAVANSSPGVGGPLAMTIFTRPQWCIEPLRPHDKGEVVPGCPDSDRRGLIGGDCERGLRGRRSRRRRRPCLGVGRASASCSALLRFVLSGSQRDADQHFRCRAEQERASGHSHLNADTGERAGGC